MRYRIRKSTAEDGELLVSIWRSSVAHTHHFVSREDLVAIDLEVQHFLPASSVWLAVDESGDPIAFMGLAGDTLESLFVAGEHRGRGAGRALVAHALQGSSTLNTVVNEQNEAALGFYRHVGFAVAGRSTTDEEGRPYPILHLRLER